MSTQTAKSTVPAAAAPSKLDALKSLVREAKVKEPYFHPALLAEMPREVNRRNTRPYICASINSSAVWFEAKTATGTKLVASTQFNPVELGSLCAALAEAGVEALEISVFAKPDSPAEPFTGSVEKAVAAQAGEQAEG